MVVSLVVLSALVVLSELPPLEGLPLTERAILVEIAGADVTADPAVACLEVVPADEPEPGEPDDEVVVVIETLAFAVVVVVVVEVVVVWATVNFTVFSDLSL